MDKNIAIIGAGPRGTYALRRLALALESRPGLRPVTIHHIERTGVFGGGGVHNPAQPHYLLLNTVARQITAFGDDDAEALAAEERRTLYGFLASRGWAGGPDDYPARALHGEYLAAMQEWTAARLPAGVRLQRHHDEVVDLREVPGGLELALGAGEVLSAARVLLVTGHARNRIKPGSREAELSDFARRRQAEGRNTSYVHYVYPLPASLDRVQPGEPVYVVGMGLTAVDVARSLTHGRGGVFRDGRYVPSGREPRMMLGSRLGVPFAARGVNQRDEAYRPALFTADHVQRLRERKGRLDFQRDLFPLIRAEMELVHGWTLRGDAFRDACLACAGEAEREALVAREIPPDQRLDWPRLADPLLDRRTRPSPWFDSSKDYAGFVLDLMRQDVAEAAKGNRTSPVKAAVDAVLRDTRDILRQAVNFSGLTPASHRDFLSNFGRVNNRLAVGPPKHCVEELIQLAEAGVVRFSGPNPAVEPDPQTGDFVVRSPEVPAPPFRARHMLDGRVHGVDIESDASPLTTSLLKSGLIRPYVNTMDGDAFQPGGLDIDEAYRVVTRDGEPHPHLSAVGVMAEGKLWFNAADARPDVNSTAITQLDEWAGRVVKEMEEMEE